MDRARSAQFNDGLCPWLSNEQEFDVENLGKITVKIANDPKYGTLAQKSEQMKIIHRNKVKKLMQQHRLRLLKRKSEASAKSLELVQQDPINKDIIKAKNERPSYQSRLNIEKIVYKRSITLSKLGEAQQLHLSQIKSSHPWIRNNGQQERQMIQALYRSKPGNRNADKYYGSLNRKTQLLKPRICSTILLSRKEAPALGPSIRKIDSSLSYHAPKPISSVVKVKLINYRSSKSMQKIKLMAAGPKKIFKFQRQKNHVLDRILPSR